MASLLRPPCRSFGFHRHAMCQVSSGQRRAPPVSFGAKFLKYVVTLKSKTMCREIAESDGVGGSQKGPVTPQPKPPASACIGVTHG
jgi:hypothetical protein